MDNREIAIRLKGVKKQYQLGAIGGSTLQKELQSWWAKKQGKEDPNLLIGSDERLIGQRFWALNGIDLEIHKGERLGIIGANGAGKSTLLKLLSRITAPTEGEIEIWGRVSSMLEVGTGFHGEMTGRENIYMNGAILGMSKSEIDAKMEEIIEFSEVRDFIDTPVKRYSSGMFVKLAFAVAANLNSQIMIMDEVLAVGDMAFQNKCLTRMRRNADEEGRTILYVSHNMQTIRTLCERCIVLNQGKIVYDGDVEKAIAVYMKTGMDNSETEVDLSDRAFYSRRYKTGFSLKHMSLTDKSIPVYGPDEDLRMKLTVNVEKPFDQVAFRAILLNDASVRLGTMWTPIMRFSEPGEYVISIVIPLKQIESGDFYSNIGFFLQDGLGSESILDQAERALHFEVQPTPVWNMGIRGYMRLPEIILTGIEKQDS